MTKLFSFFKQYAFEWLLMIFSVGIPFALDMGPAFYGILGSFFYFPYPKKALLLGIFYRFPFHTDYLCTLSPPNHLVWSPSCNHDWSFLRDRLTGIQGVCPVPPTLFLPTFTI